MLYLAIAITKLHATRVTILGKFDSDLKERYEGFFKLDLSDITFEITKDYSHALKETARSADVFISQLNFRMMDTEPKQYVLALQIPYGRITPWSMGRKIMRGNIKDLAKDILRLRLLRFAKRDAQLVLSNSQFVRDTLRRNYGIESHLLYPPISDFLVEGIPRRNIILSVGRFFRGLYNDKRYDVLTSAFRKLSRQMTDWEYHIVGSASPGRETTRYIETLRKENAGFPIFFHINEKLEHLARLYNTARIYWHGAGYGVDENKYPEKTEHFGMSVVEAMSARCVPVVVDKGGLREIVNHGVDGFLWDTTDQLIEYTLNVAGLSPDQLDTLHRKARDRYQRFAVNNFDRRVAEIFSPILARSDPGS